ncbi:metallophosphoesterase family protein [Candidatus Pacearchaeota archaeon]|nr:metallophosphoesterase family protein [Candidatus Pacearchaeota archaeon]
MVTKGKKLRILAAGDVHGDSRITKKLAEKAEKENVDLVILCGDLTGWTETKEVIKPFKDKNKKVLIIPGNHDSFATVDFLATLYGVKNIHGYSAKYEDVGIFGAGGADLGLSAESEDEMFKTLKQAHSGLKGIEKKIMITHMHPSGSLSEVSGFEGSKAITKAIKEFHPDILLHSHIHEAEGVEEIIGKTKVINVGKSGKIIEI